MSKKPIPIENQEFPDDDFNQDVCVEEYQDSYDEFSQETYDDDVQYEVPEVVPRKK
ncbi:hypothetical protein RFI02_02310 [Acinetobacter sichuanensis]|uniref:hypothetical protein n=1 Tax=Acinetobacter sichuanensis TaxID=2136183 RepID=UPI00280F602C|nr:hypothetical protein [Acinetobacter sichuanensis]MDQ9019934.1 hypothetical protein [Acinetobacter sichuanensis]